MAGHALSGKGRRVMRSAHNFALLAGGAYIAVCAMCAMNGQCGGNQGKRFMASIDESSQ